jgi:hypothetical protein
VNNSTKERVFVAGIIFVSIFRFAISNTQTNIYLLLPFEKRKRKTLLLQYLNGGTAGFVGNFGGSTISPLSSFIS